MPKTTAADLFTPSAAAREVGVTRQAVNDRIASGKMRVTEIGGVTFVTRKEIAAWKEDRRRRARALAK